jgi:hypothetical protein
MKTTLDKRAAVTASATGDGLRALGLADDGVATPSSLSAAGVAAPWAARPVAVAHVAGPYQPRSTGHDTAWPYPADAQRTADGYAARLVADRVYDSIDELASVLQALSTGHDTAYPADARRTADDYAALAGLAGTAGGIGGLARIPPVAAKQPRVQAAPVGIHRLSSSDSDANGPVYSTDDSSWVQG